MITYQVDRHNNELRVIAIGAITLKEIQEHLLHEEKQLQLSYRELIDARHAVVGFLPGEVRDIVHMLRRLARRTALGPTAVVVADQTAYGVMRLLQMLVEDVCIIQPFCDNMDEAQRWLRNWISP